MLDPSFWISWISLLQNLPGTLRWWCVLLISEKEIECVTFSWVSYVCVDEYVWCLSHMVKFPKCILGNLSWQKNLPKRKDYKMVQKKNQYAVVESQKWQYEAWRWVYRHIAGVSLSGAIAVSRDRLSLSHQYCREQWKQSPFLWSDSVYACMSAGFSQHAWLVGSGLAFLAHTGVSHVYIHVKVTNILCILLKIVSFDLWIWLI